MKLPPKRLSVARPKYLSVKCGNNYNDITVFDRWFYWYFWRNYYCFIDAVVQNRHKLNATWQVTPYKGEMK